MTRLPILGTQPVNLDHPLNRGLVSWWKVLPQWSGGDTLRDLMRVNSADDGNLTGMTAASWTAGPLFGALEYSTSYVDVSAYRSADFSGGKYTVSAWCYADSNGHWQTIFKNWTVSKGWIHFGQHNGINDLSNYLVESGDAQKGPARFGSGLPTGRWVHCVVVADGSDCYVYQDCVVGATSFSYDGTLKTSITTAAIGVKLDLPGDPATTPGYWDGRIDDVRIYNRGLSAAEVCSLYEQSQQRFSPLLNWLRVPLTTVVEVGPGGNAPTGNLHGPLYGPLGGVI